MRNYNSIYPNVNLSGYALLGNLANEIESELKAYQNLGVGNIIGAGSVVVKDIHNNTKV